MTSDVATLATAEAAKPRRKSKGATPTARALAECRKRGWTACVVEKWIAQTKQRKDAFGFGDILAIEPGASGALLLQVTGDHGGHVMNRVAKIRTECGPAARAWLAAGNRVQVWGYGRRGAEGARKLWTLRVIDVTLATLGQAEAPDAT